MPAALSYKLKALPWQLTTFLTAAFVLDMPGSKKKQVMPPNVNYYLLRCACVFLCGGGGANSWVRSVPPYWFAWVWNFKETATGDAAKCELLFVSLCVCVFLLWGGGGSQTVGWCLSRRIDLHECETSRKYVHDTICKAEPWGFAISGVRSVPPHSIDLREIRLDLHYIIFSIMYILLINAILPKNKPSGQVPAVVRPSLAR